MTIRRDHHGYRLPGQHESIAPLDKNPPNGTNANSIMRFIQSRAVTGVICPQELWSALPGWCIAASVRVLA